MTCNHWRHRLWNPWRERQLRRLRRQISDQILVMFWRDLGEQARREKARQKAREN